MSKPTAQGRGRRSAGARAPRREWAASCELATTAGAGRQPSSVLRPFPLGQPGASAPSSSCDMTTSCSGASGPQGRTSRSSSPAAAACVVAAVACVGAWALLGRAGSGPPPALAAPRTAAAGSLAAVPPPACPAAAAATAAARARSRRCRRLCASLGEGAEGPARAASGALAASGRAEGAGRGGDPAGAARGAPAAPAPLGGLCTEGKRARCIAAHTRKSALPCGWRNNQQDRPLIL